MSDLEATRDHARRMANFEHPDRPTTFSITCYRNHELGDCRRPPTHCACSCHDVLGPTPTEQALWRQIADEIDAYLAPADDGPDLFGEASA